MSAQLPFAIPSRIPSKIDPCPIVEAVMEVRFVPARPWAHFPGLFAEHFGARFPKEVELGVASIPEAIRQQDPNLVHAPHRRMIGETFLLQFGPRSLSLITKQNDYPGWERFIDEGRRVFAELQRLKVIRETTRFGLRYINFFEFNIFERLTMTMSFQGGPVVLPETGLHTVFHDEMFRHFVQINNASVVNGKKGVTKLGSILDIDATFSAPTTDLEKAAELFGAAHQSEKKVFFGLLKPEFVDTLNPIYP